MSNPTSNLIKQSDQSPEKEATRVGKFMTQCQKPWINPGFMMSYHKQVYDSLWHDCVINCQKHIFWHWQWQVASLSEPLCGKSEIYLLPDMGSIQFRNAMELLNLELKLATKHLIHKLIYHLIFSFRNIPSMTILLGI